MWSLSNILSSILLKPLPICKRFCSSWFLYNQTSYRCSCRQSKTKGTISILKHKYDLNFNIATNGNLKCKIISNIYSTANRRTKGMKHLDTRVKWLMHLHFNREPFSLTWDPIGVKILKCYSPPLKSLLSLSKLFLNFLLSSPHKSTLLYFWTFWVSDFWHFFLNSPLYPMGKQKTQISHSA